MSSSDELQQRISDLNKDLTALRDSMNRRDQVNGELLSENKGFLEENEELRKQLTLKRQIADNKSMSALDARKRSYELKQANASLRTQVESLKADACATWQEGLTKFLDDIIQKRLNDRLEDLSYWSDNE